MHQLSIPLDPPGVNPAVVDLVTAAIGCSLRPGIPSPIVRVLSGETYKAKFGLCARAEVEMFDGCRAALDVGRWCDEPDGWTHVWSRMDGGPAVLKRGRWVRAKEHGTES